MKIDDLFKFNSEINEEHWISVSDLMAGLMIIFLFIAIFYNFQNEEEYIKQRNNKFDKVKNNINSELSLAFKDNWKKLNAILIEEELVVRFNVTDDKILFKTDSYYLEKIFRKQLDIFFPRYLKILNSYKECISEIRIEGHTSSKWKGKHPNPEWKGQKNKNGNEFEDYFEGKNIPQEYNNYFSNMGLSQDRSKEVLKYSLLLPMPTEQRNWAKDISTANGLSSSDIVFMDDEKEDEDASRRVEFKIVLDNENVETGKCRVSLWN